MDSIECEIYEKGCSTDPGYWTKENIQKVISEERILTKLRDKHAYITSSVPEILDKDRGEYLSNVNYGRLEAILWWISFLILPTIHKAYSVGSRREGTHLHDSDYDLMVVYHALNRDEASDIIIPINDTPGFCVMNLSHAKDETVKRLPLQNVLKKVQDQVYLSGLKIKVLEKQLNQKQASTKGSSMLFDDSTLKNVANKYKQKSRPLRLELDMATAVACEGWPVTAESWVSRERQWPDQDLVREIQATGYHLVPKVAPGCNLDPDIQWRLSFSFAEIKLMESLNGVCLLTYRIVKQLVKEHNLLDPEMCTSYHLKTAFLWVCEQYPQEWWKHGRLAKCIHTLLARLQDACLTKQLPHYFIHKLNLFENVPRDRLAMLSAELLKVIENIKVTSFDVPKTPDTSELACTVILMAMEQHALQKVQEDLTKIRPQLVLNVLSNYVEFKRRESQHILSFYSMITCMYQHGPHKARVCVSAIEYMINCAFVAVSFIYSYFSARLRAILAEWHHLFPEQQAEAFLFTAILGIEGNKENLPKPIALFNKYSKLFSQYDTLTNRVYDKFISILEWQPNEYLRGNHADVLQRLGLKPDDFIHKSVLDSLECRFELPKESFLTIHDMANPYVWIKGLTYDEVKEQVKTQGHRTCSWDSFCKSLHASTRILEERGLNRDLHMHTVICKDYRGRFLEGDQVASVHFTMLRDIIPSTTF